MPGLFAASHQDKLTLHPAVRCSPNVSRAGALCRLLERYIQFDYQNTENKRGPMNLVSRQIINDAAHDLAILFLQSRAGEPSVTDTFPVVEILGGGNLYQVRRSS